MRSGARVLAALLVVVASSSYGLVAVGAAAAAAPPSGGCWAYAPSAAGLDSPPATDVSTTLEPWTTVADGGFLLESGGDTVVGGSRTARLEIGSGPVISATDDVAGTASFLLSVDGDPLAEPVEVPFEADAGDPVEDLVAEVELPGAAAGAHTVRLDAVYFDAPADSLRVACNGQESGTPATNPATDPLPTDLTSAYTLVAASSVAITDVDDQDVLTAGRPGDLVTVALSGMASSAMLTLQVCDAAAACAVVAAFMSEPDGTATTTFMVPASAPVGADSLTVSDGTTTVTTPLTVLGVQVVAAAEALDEDSTTVTLTGTGWDPERDVTIRGYAGGDSSSAATDDPEVAAAVDAAGEFTAEFVVAAEDTESVIVDQARSDSSIGAVYLISGVIGSGAAADPDPTDDPDPTSSPSPSAGATTAPVVPPVTPPVDIPLPSDIPVDEPPTETPTETPAPVDLSVTEARLDGEATLGELFGGSPKRDLVFLVTNAGAETVENPVVRVSIGRSDDIEPELVDAEVGVLGPGEQAVVTVPLELPMAAFGTYQVVGQVGETDNGGFQVEWTTYPWGLFALNALALALLAWGVRHRMLLRRPAGAGALAPAADGDAVVDLAAADAWWAYRAGTGPRPRGVPVAPGLSSPAVPLPPVPDESLTGEAVVDLEAAEKWWARRPGRGGSRAS